MTMSIANTPLLAVGTYTLKMPHVDGKGRGIELLRFDPATATLSAVGGYPDLTNPSYLCVSQDRRHLYSVREIGADGDPGIDVFTLDAQGATLQLEQRISSPGEWPCYIAVDATSKLLLLSNYLSGEVLAYPLATDGLVIDSPTILQRSGQGPNPERQEGPHAHCALVSPDGRFAYLADLGIDAVVRHAIDAGKVNPEADLTLPAVPGAGPRHLAFTADGKHLLVNHELGSSVSLYRLDGPQVRRLAEASSLPPAFDGQSGAGGMHLHPSERFVYVANRGHDSLFAARVDVENGSLTPIGTWPSGGRTPRDFTFSPDGGHLLCASQDDAVIRIFSIDPHSGELTHVGEDYPIASAVCLQFI